MGEWVRTRLGMLAEIKHGFAFKGEYFHDEPPGDFLLTPGNFAIGGGFQWGKRKYYRGPVPEEYVLSPGDLLVTMTDLSKEADTLGYAAVVPQTEERLLHNQRLGKVIVTDASLDKDFLHWLLRSQDYRNEVLASHTGSTVKHSSPTKILSFEFLLPPLEEQRAIASILGALDDKIDLNRRMNETLEGMARAIFKDWFVDFGPTRAKMEGREPYLAPELWALFPDRLDDEGKPEGWEMGELQEIIELNPREPLMQGVEAPYLDMAALPTQGSNPDSAVNRAFTSGMRFRNGDTLMARITPCLENGKTAFVQSLPDDTVGWGSTEFIVLRAKPPVPAALTYLLARDASFRAHAIQSMTGTSGRQRARTEALANYPVSIPDESVWSALAGLIEPIFERIRANGEEFRTLAQTRDLLLPKLVSGEIRVGSAEKLLEAAL